VDVQACFDTIPQQAVLKVVRDLLDTGEYLVTNEARVKPPEATTLRKGERGIRPVVKFTSNAKAADYMAFGFEDAQGAAIATPGNSVLVAPLGQQSYRQQQIEDMITEHVEFNLIKIGRKYYRQKNGIPQGSVLSSMLCNFFYGRLEREELRFLQQRRDDTCLLRLIDDFLLITTERQLAERFLNVMHKGLPEYGVAVKPAKSLANFEYSIDGSPVPLLAGGTAFPYCGLAIDMANLDISKSSQLKVGTTASDSLTVEYSNTPGRTFRRKALK
jgi:telomerase reverse transcriptase